MLPYRFILFASLCLAATRMSAQGSRSSLYLYTQYQLAAGQRAGTDVVTLSNGKTLNNRLNYSLANGLLLQAGWSSESDSVRAGWSAGLRAFEGLPAFTATYKGDSLSNEYAYSTLRLRHLMADLGGFVHYGTGRLHMRTSLGLLLPLYRRGTETTVWNMQGGFSGEEQRTVKYRFSPGFRAGQEMRLLVSGPVWLMGGFEFGLTGAARKSRVISDYSDSKGGSITDVYPHTADRKTDYLSELQWENADRINDPALSGFDKNRPRQALTYADPAGYWAIRFGMIWYLNEGK